MPLKKYIENFGRAVREALEKLGGEIRLFAQSLYWIILGVFVNKPISGITVSNQMVFAGVRSTTIVAFVALFTGIVLAMQSAYQLVQFGVKSLVASLVSVSMCR
ncbi:MAG: ABC transporter permease, partial [Candidatus Omnitrophica bacterium]|nr:ABC transporter permease [Candidatus Omnitrophota bacterium]